MAKPKHGGCGTPEYRTWQDMLRRCRNQNRKDYPRYGGRGITVCQRWQDSFAAFLADMGPRPSPDHSIERRENAGPYSPENCYWGTRQQQARNRRSSTVLTIDGVSRTLAEWVEVTGIPHNTISMRLNVYGWDVRRALTTPVAEGHVLPILAKPETKEQVLRWRAAGLSYSRIAERLGCSLVAVFNLVKRLKA